MEGCHAVAHDRLAHRGSSGTACLDAAALAAPGGCFACRRRHRDSLAQPAPHRQPGCSRRRQPMIMIVILVSLLAVLFTGIPFFAGLPLYGGGLLLLVQGQRGPRSEDRRAGKGCVRTWRSGWAPCT